MKKLFTFIAMALMAVCVNAQEDLTIEGLPITFDGSWSQSFLVPKTDVKAGDQFCFIGTESAVSGWNWGAQIHPKSNAEGWASLGNGLSLKDGKATFEVTEEFATIINSNGGLRIQGIAVTITGVQYLAAKDYDVTTIWEGNVVLSWSDNANKVFIPASKFQNVPAGSIMTVCYSQVNNQWDQAQFNYGDWGAKPNFTEGDFKFDGTMVPTDLYGWTFANRETPLVLTQTILDEIQAHKQVNEGVGEEEIGIIIQGTGLTFTKVTVSIERTPSGVSAINAAKQQNGVRYNLAGQKVDESYKGVVIMNGRKMVQK